MVTRYILDTNTISYVARNRSAAARDRLEAAQEVSQVYVSAVTEGEILFGLARRPEAHKVAYFMHAALVSLKVLAWNSAAAHVYAGLRARNEGRGISLGALDMLIAAHASAVGAVLVTSDAAFGRLSGGPRTMDWADDLRAR